MLDRAFRSLNLLEFRVAAGIPFVIRRNLGAHPPKFYDEEGREVKLHLVRGQRVVYRSRWYKGQVRVRVIGEGLPGQPEPLWVMTDLEPEQNLAYDRQRMKMEERFRDLKSLLGMARVMDKRQERMEKALALVLLASAVALRVGERLRDALFGGRKRPAKGTPPPRGSTRGYGGAKGGGIPSPSCCGKATGRFRRPWGAEAKTSPRVLRGSV